MTDIQTSSNNHNGGCLRTFGIILITMMITIIATYWFITSYLFPTKFDPVTLNQKEEHVLISKLRQLGIQAK